jgi:hypothetical protein
MTVRSQLPNPERWRFFSVVSEEEWQALYLPLGVFFWTPSNVLVAFSMEFTGRANCPPRLGELMFSASSNNRRYYEYHVGNTCLFLRWLATYTDLAGWRPHDACYGVGSWSFGMVLESEVRFLPRVVVPTWEGYR